MRSGVTDVEQATCCVLGMGLRLACAFASVCTLSVLVPVFVSGALLGWGCNDLPADVRAAWAGTAIAVGVAIEFLLLSWLAAACVGRSVSDPQFDSSSTRCAACSSLAFVALLPLCVLSAVFAWGCHGLPPDAVTAWTGMAVAFAVAASCTACCAIASGARSLRQ